MTETERLLSKPKSPTGVTDRELFLMRHSTRVAASLLKAYEGKPMLGATPEQIAALRRELNLREFCLANIVQAGRLRGAAAIWWVYMMGHARLQIARYAGDLQEDDFQEGAKALREKRDAEDKNSAGVAWLLPEEIV